MFYDGGNINKLVILYNYKNNMAWRHYHVWEYNYPIDETGFVCAYCDHIGQSGAITRL